MTSGIIIAPPPHQHPRATNAEYMVYNIWFLYTLWEFYKIKMKATLKHNKT